MNYTPKELTAFRCPNCGGMVDLFVSSDPRRGMESRTQVHFRCRGKGCLAEGKIEEVRRDVKTS